MPSIWRENMLGYLSTDVILSERRTVFRERMFWWTEMLVICDAREVAVHVARVPAVKIVKVAHYSFSETQ